MGDNFCAVSGRWDENFENILTAREIRLWNRKAPENTLQILDFLRYNSICQRLHAHATSWISTSPYKPEIRVTTKQNGILNGLLGERYEQYCDYWDIWLFIHLEDPMDIQEWNESKLSDEESVKVFIEENLNIYF